MVERRHDVPTAGIALPAAVADGMRAELPKVAEQVVGAIRAEVPSYADPFKGEMGRNIENAVALALDGFLTMASSTDAGGSEQGRQALDRVFAAAYALGRGEARSRRSMEALLSAYRVGARVAWRDMSESLVAAGLAAGSIARFAELVFAYIDELSAVSAAGHADQLATTGRVRQRYLERLTQGLLRGAEPDELEAAAERAEWPPDGRRPSSLTAVVLPDAESRAALSALHPHSLQPTEQVPGLEGHPELTVLLVPNGGGRSRSQLMRRLAGRHAVVGPARPWQSVLSSYARALRMVELQVAADDGPVDTEEYLPQLLLSADAEALADLQAQVLAPLAGLKPATADKLKDTLRCWLLHQGRREEVAAALFVHPQTVRYRMQQLRELYGDRLEEPDWVRKLILAL